MKRDLNVLLIDMYLYSILFAVRILFIRYLYLLVGRDEMERVALLHMDSTYTH